MALDLTSYTGLQAAIAKFVNRGDLAAEIPGFIQLAEAEIGRRLRRKTITRTIQIAAQSTTLPSDCAELRSVHPLTASKSQDRPLRVVTPEVLSEIRANFASGGRPIAASLIGGSLVVAPAPDTTYTLELQYFEKLAPLSASTATNSVLAESPDLYLYGALMHVAPYLEHDERIPTWVAAFERALSQLDTAREREEFSGSLRPVRLGRVF